MTWLLIAVAESIHGTIRQLFIAPAIGDLPARQIGVFIGSAIVFAIAWLCILWIGAVTVGQQLRVGALWVMLIVAFEIGLGLSLGYSRERMLSDYDLADGGLMGFGLLFLLFAPMMAAKIRGVDPQQR
jgi:hypothetical protein